MASNTPAQEQPAAERESLSVKVGPFADETAARQFVSDARTIGEDGSLQQPKFRRSRRGVNLLLRYAGTSGPETLAELESLANAVGVGITEVREKPRRRPAELLALTVGEFANEARAKEFARQIVPRTGNRLAERPTLARSGSGYLLSFRVASNSPNKVRAQIEELAGEAGVRVTKAALASPPRVGDPTATHLLSLTLGSFPNLELAREFVRGIPAATGLSLSERPQTTQVDSGLNMSLKIGSSNPAEDRQKIRALAADYGVVIRADSSAPNAGAIVTPTATQRQNFAIGYFADEENARMFMRALSGETGIDSDRRPSVVSDSHGLALKIAVSGDDIATLRSKIGLVADQYHLLVADDIEALQLLKSTDKSKSPDQADQADAPAPDVQELRKEPQRTPLAPLPVGDISDERSQIDTDDWDDPLEVEGGLRAYVTGIPTRKVATAFTRSLSGLAPIVEITRSDIDRTGDGLQLALGFAAEDREAGWATLLELAEAADLRVIDANSEPVNVLTAAPELEPRIPDPAGVPKIVDPPVPISKDEAKAHRLAELRAMPKEELDPLEIAEIELADREGLKATLKQEVATPLIKRDDEKTKRVPDPRMPEREKPVHEGEPKEKEIGPAIGWVRVGGKVQSERELQLERDRLVDELSPTEAAPEVELLEEEELEERRSILKLLTLKTVKWGLNGAFVTATLAAVLLFAGTLVPTMLGYKTMIVTSGSMEPTIHVGDAILIAEGNAPGSLGVDDIVTFNDGGTSGMVTHRISLVKDIQGRKHFQTKGDANVTADPNLVPIEAVYGKSVFRLPKFGYLLTFAGTSRGKLFLIVFPLVFLMAKELLGLLKGAQVKKPDDEDVPDDPVDEDDLENPGERRAADGLDLRDAVAHA